MRPRGELIVYGLALVVGAVIGVYAIESGASRPAPRVGGAAAGGPVAPIRTPDATRSPAATRSVASRITADRARHAEPPRPRRRTAAPAPAVVTSSVPSATPTPVPTASPSPTATATPAPVTTPVPTAVATPVPTATPAPTAVSFDDSG